MNSLSVSPVINVINTTMKYTVNANNGNNLKHLNGGDICILVIYFIIVLATGLYVSFFYRYLLLLYTFIEYITKVFKIFISNQFLK